MSNELDSDQLLAWWTYPGDGEGFSTFDELEEAFKQFLLQRASHMEEQLGYQKSDYGCPRKLEALVALIASSLSSVDAAKEENLKDIRDHRALLYASVFLRKKYEASRQTVPNRAQLEMHVAELNHDLLEKMPSMTKRPNSDQNREFNEASDGDDNSAASLEKPTAADVASPDDSDSEDNDRSESN